MNRILSAPKSTFRHIRRTTAAVAAFPADDSNPYQILWHYQVLDPNSDIATHWNHVFLFTSLVALFIDPLYFYIPRIGGPACIEREIRPAVMITIFRSLTDLFYLLHMIIKFRTAFVAPSSRVFGRGELVMDPREIAIRYLKNDFVIDLAAMLPLPQLVAWFVIPATRDSRVDHTNNTLALIVIFQYIPRMFLIYPLNQQIIKSTGIVAKTAWAGAGYNLILYMLASHLTGAAWYLIAVGRQFHCWDVECRTENSLQVISCLPHYLDCASQDQLDRKFWLNVTKVTTNCDPRNSMITFRFGMYEDGVTSGVAEESFFDKLLYCFWWGLRNLSSYGQNLETSTFYGETTFCILINVFGLILFSQLIGKMQNYLQSLTVRLEEWRIKRRDTEEWMRHRQLPPVLQERVRRFVQYKWLATRGVDEESILQEIPLDLRRQIQRHLCLSLVRRVPFFSQVDDQLLDAICQRLVSSLYTAGTCIFEEGDPVNEMLFIIRGKLESSTTNGGRLGFFNSITLRPGDFCGEELLTWVLMPTSSDEVPVSTRTVKALCEVEAFALPDEDLKIVANQFKRLHSKKVQHAFRYYSQQWRAWGACFLQEAWRRYKKRQMSNDLAAQESFYYEQTSDQYSEDTDEYYEDTRNGTQQKTVGGTSDSSLKMPEMSNTDEPDYNLQWDSIRGDDNV